MDAPASEDPQAPQGPEPSDTSAPEVRANAEAAPAAPTVTGQPAEGALTPAAAADDASAPASVEAGTSETGTSETGTSETGGATTTSAAADDSVSADTEASPGDAASGEAGTASADGKPDGAAPEAGGGRKRKRRRKKKTPENPEAAAEAEAKRAAAPFARLFPAGAPKRHAFAVGEVVAGRIQRFEDGGILVDLFGKALAVADEFEPREIPPEPAPPEPAPTTETAPGTLDAPNPDAPAAAAEGAAGADAAAEGSDAATEGSDAATEGADAAEPTAAEAPSATPEGAPDAGSVAVAAATDDVAAEAPAAYQATPEPAAALETAAAVSESTAEAAPPAEEAAAEAPESAAPAAQSTAEQGAADADGTQADSKEETSAGDVAAEAAGPKGPLSVAPVVPEEFGRPEPLPTGGIYKGRIGAVAESGHIVILNRNLDRAATKAQVRAFRDERRRVEGLVFGYNRGGFDVLVAGIRAFCPASAMALGEIPDPEAFVGRKYEFLLPSGKGGKDLIVSRRSILEREARKRARELLRSLQPGQRLSGKVTSVRDFGVFVDVGGVEGLVHQSELSYGFGVKPASVCSVGDDVEVKVLKVGEGPKKKGAEPGKKERRDRQTRISLSIKALLPDPWDSHAEAITEGGVREGKVTRTTEFGAFVELVPTIEGLVHISDFGRDLAHANQAVAEGEQLHVVVERVDRKARRISLSRLTGAELEDFKAGKLDTSGAVKNIRQGATIKVLVDKPEARGIVVRVPGAIGRRARGFIPGSETGTDRGSDLRKRFPIGSELEVKVIGQDRDGGLKCSIKALKVDEERQAVRDYRREASKQGFGTFGDLLKAKLDQ